MCTGHPTTGYYLNNVEQRVILHADLDAFFASVEQRDNPALQGKPVLVGGTGLRSVVCAASYAARKHGCRSAMPMVKAKRLCPGAIVIPPRFDAYQKASSAFFHILSSCSPLVEPLSIDEAFVDLTGTSKLLGPPLDVALGIQKRVDTELGLVASIGIAPTKFAAKIASDLEKPKGLVVVDPKRLDSFLSPLPISRLWGVGPKLQAVLETKKIHTFRDLMTFPKHDLIELLGPNTAERLSMLSSGVDRRPVQISRQVKSVGKETTFSSDTSDMEYLKKQIQSLSDQVAKNLRQKDLKANTVTLKIKFYNFESITRQTQLDEFTDDGFLLSKRAEALLKNENDKNGGIVPVRLIGVSTSRFLGSIAKNQLELFGENIPSPEGQAMGKTLDAINEKFGSSPIVRANTLELTNTVENK